MQICVLFLILALSKTYAVNVGLCLFKSKMILYDTTEKDLARDFVDISKLSESLNTQRIEAEKIQARIKPCPTIFA